MLPRVDCGTPSHRDTMVGSVILVQLASLSAVLALPAISAILPGDEGTAIVVRDKRDPSRALTFSGFMPGTGMSAFASSGDFSPFYRARRPAHRPAGWGTDEGRAEYPAEPSTVEHPPERGDGRPWAQPEGTDKKTEEEEEEEEAPVRPPKKNKKKYTPRESEEEEEENYKPSRGGGNAAASFNAWFPIMLGMYPGGGQGEDGGYSRGQGQGRGRYQPQGHSTTVIANSVSNGRSGVASSHAVAYGGGSPPQGSVHRR